MDNMKKQAKISILILLISAVYLNRAYAHIYSKFDLIQSPGDMDYMTQLEFSGKSKTLTYAALGDSLTAGVGASSADFSLPALLAERISQSGGMPVAVKNLAVPGATSLDLYAKQIAEVSQLKPDMVTIFIGINDVHNFVPLDQFRANLMSSINALRQTTKAKIYLINLPYIGASDLILPPYDLFFKIKIKQYNKAIAEVAEATGAKLINIETGSAQQLGLSSDNYSIDRFHPSDKGYQLWANLIYDGLK